KTPVTRGQFARFVRSAGDRTDAERGTSGGSGVVNGNLVRRRGLKGGEEGVLAAGDVPVVGGAVGGRGGVGAVGWVAGVGGWGRGGGGNRQAGRGRRSGFIKERRRRMGRPLRGMRGMRRGRRIQWAGRRRTGGDWWICAGMCGSGVRTCTGRTGRAGRLWGI